jgi:ribosomal protein L12E/L44/L45/RPP1/RPP2
MITSQQQSLPQTEKMKHLAAYLLLGLAGNSSPSAKDIKGVLDSVGIEADDDRLDTLLSELKGKDINEVGYQHRQMMRRLPCFCAFYRKIDWMDLTVDC